MITGSMCARNTSSRNCEFEFATSAQESLPSLFTVLYNTGTKIVCGTVENSPVYIENSVTIFYIYRRVFQV